MYFLFETLNHFMNRHILFASITIITFSLLTNCAKQNQLKIISAFNNIDTIATSVNFSNDFEINNIGGHIQGIQSYENKQGEYVFMSGSSDTYSYCTVVKLGDENKVISVNKLMDRPFKHAGGFQIFKNYLAVGIEDNTIKDKARVCIYDISAHENPFNKPIAVIGRNGDSLRSTAGCVGITKYKNRILLAVGDWDTKHIDFYSSETDKITGNEFIKTGTVDTQNMSRKGWINNEWLSYQNINLFNINNQLFLIGLGQNAQSENIADLFGIIEESPGTFSFKKVASITLNCTSECTFKAAAGVEFANGKFKIFAFGYNVSATSYLNVFGNE